MPPERSPLLLGRYRGVRDGEDRSIFRRRSPWERGAARDCGVKTAEQLLLGIVRIPEGVLEVVQVPAQLIGGTAIRWLRVRPFLTTAVFVLLPPEPALSEEFFDGLHKELRPCDRLGDFFRIELRHLAVVPALAAIEGQS